MGARWPVDRARAAALGTAACEAIPPVQFAQYLFDGDLLAQAGEVEAKAGHRRRFRSAERVACARSRGYLGWCWGDRSPFGTLSFAAPSFFCFQGRAAGFVTGGRLRQSKGFVGLPDGEDQM